MNSKLIKISYTFTVACIDIFNDILTRACKLGKGCHNIIYTYIINIYIGMNNELLFHIIILYTINTNLSMQVQYIIHNVIFIIHIY